MAKLGTKRSIDVDFKVNPEASTVASNIISSSTSGSSTTTVATPASSEEPLKKKPKYPCKTLMYNRF